MLVRGDEAGEAVKGSRCLAAWREQRQWRQWRRWASDGAGCV